jgi:hypothetical protein
MHPASKYENTTNSWTSQHCTNLLDFGFSLQSFMDLETGVNRQIKADLVDIEDEEQPSCKPPSRKMRTLSHLRHQFVSSSNKVLSGSNYLACPSLVVPSIPVEQDM